MARLGFALVAIFTLGCAEAARKLKRRQGETESAQGEWSSVYTTTNGCTCKASSECDADLGTGFRCDTCKTEGRCGTWSLSGRWGYCDYGANTDSAVSFTGQTARFKLNYYWDNVIADRTRTPKFDLLGNIASSIRTTFDNYRPEMPKGREKMIHTVGSVCKVVQEIQGSPYTGLLANGRHEGLIRMGGAVDPTQFGEGLTPGLGFKFPRSGVPDGDFVMLYSLDFGDQWNFFAKNQSNHLATIGGIATLLVIKFKEASQCPFQIGISDLARYSADGTEHSPPKFPFKLMMIPNNAISTGNGERTVDGVHAEIDALPVGTTLYTTYACQRPEGDESQPTEDLTKCGKPLRLGDVVTTSECTTTKYGDEALHIRHQRIEEDWQLEPAFFRDGEYRADTACGASVDADKPPSLCTEEGMLATDA